MARLSEDDEVAFDAFVAERRASLTRTAFLLTGDLHRAEDLVQAALLEVFRSRPRLRDRVDPVGYARRTVVTTHLNLVRRLSWREAPVAAFPDDGGAASDGHDGTVQRLALRAALLRSRRSERRRCGCTPRQGPCWTRCRWSTGCSSPSTRS